MKFPSRRKPLALILCCSFAGAVGVLDPAHAQTAAPLRVDPRLLGLPPARPVTVSPSAPADIPVAQTTPVDTPSVETRALPNSTATAPNDAARENAAPPSSSASRAGQEAKPIGMQRLPPQPGALPAPALAGQKTGREVAAARVTDKTAGAVKAVRAPSPDGSRTAPQLVVAGSAAVAVPEAAPLRLQMAKKLVLPVEETDQPQPAFISGQKLYGIVDKEMIAEENAELRKAGRVMTGDRLIYHPVDDEVEGTGNVRLTQGDDVIAGPKMRMKLEEQVGFVEPASYFFKRDADEFAKPKSGRLLANNETDTGFAAPRTINIRPGQTKAKGVKKSVGTPSEAHGDAARMDFEGENQIQLTNATYTTCKPGKEDWFMTASDLHLDYDEDVATGNDATIRFFDVPILHSPWISFSLNHQRKSGLLTPTYGSSSNSGLEFTLPYYWNIAPNMDATIAPRLLSKRGLQLGSDFRYLNELSGGVFNGKSRVEYLPSDRLRNIDRWGVSLTHTQLATTDGFSGAINFSRVSDNDYYTDLSSQITNTAKTQLLQQAAVTYDTGWWNVSTNFQTFQTLQPDPKNPITAPYRMLPQINFNARQPDHLMTDSALFGQYTHFISPNKNWPEGQRVVLQPQISLPYVTPGWYVTPRVGFNLTRYVLTSTNNTGDTSINRSLPIFSVDSGMVFERPTHLFNRDYTQTLEPRLFYLNIPYRNQNQIPVFDTGLADFNFAQIFADNKFSGWDRIGNANQLTAAVSSRLIDPANGAEIMRAMVGQRLYFTDDQVTMPGAAVRQSNKSDFLAAFSGQLLPKLYADAALQYNVNAQQFQRYSLGTRYAPEVSKVVNAGFSYNADAATPIKQLDLSGQWPITGRWQAIGRYNYSFLQKQPIEVIGGLEYNAGCWAVRAVGHRVQTTQANASTQIFLQLELSEFARLGTSPLDLLQRNVPGYSLMNQTVVDHSAVDR